MAVACSFNPSNPKLYQTTTGSVTGGAATTAYQMVIVNPAGHTQVINFKTDGSGNATVLVVPPVAASSTSNYVWNIYTAAPTSVANGSFNTSGHS